MYKLQPQKFLAELFDTAVRSASPEICLPEHLAKISEKEVCVIGAGKSAAAMARVAENNLKCNTYGVVLTPYGHNVDCGSIEVLEAAHPVPDDAGVKAAQKILNVVAGLDASSFVLCLMSGGASALLTLPASCITLAQKQAMTRELLHSGADIEEINCVRKHFSLIKGGRLMKAIYPAKALTLCISDVVGDHPATIGSGPTVPDPSTCADALQVIRKYRISIPVNALNELNSGKLETPKPQDKEFENTEVVVVASADIALESYGEVAEQNGIVVHKIGTSVEGETNQVAKEHARQVRQMIANQSHKTPFVVLSGGETTVPVSGKGKGGPNTQFALALAIELNGNEGIYAVACDTDGIDGSGDNAGAMITPSTLERARRKNLEPQVYLDNNDSYNFFKELGDLVKTGPTLTNINDFRAILYIPGESD